MGGVNFLFIPVLQLKMHLYLQQDYSNITIFTGI
jgi:hypothetical protein